MDWENKALLGYQKAEFQVAGKAPLGPVALGMEVDLKNYFMTPQDTPDKLGIMAQIDTGVRIPLFGGFSLRLGVDSFLFTGKTAETRQLGSSMTPSIGIRYDATWKPVVGLIY